MNFNGLLKNRIALILGAGQSLLDYQPEIKNFIKKNKCVTIGINNMTHLFVPDFHLWTNTKRFKSFAKNINSRSTILIGNRVPKKIIKSNFTGRYSVVYYEDWNDGKYKIDNNTIYGPFRTAGLLAIAVASAMLAKKIYIAGMDGYTLYPENELNTQRQNQHCYSRGYSDDATWDDCTKKDNIVSESLRILKKYMDFSIITPTKFEEFYDTSILCPSQEK